MSACFNEEVKRDRRPEGKAARLCWAAIEDACPVLLEEGGVEEVLKFLAIIMHGEVVPASIVKRLQQQAAVLGGNQTRSA
jgi:hypothetical protein